MLSTFQTWSLRTADKEDASGNVNRRAVDGIRDGQFGTSYRLALQGTTICLSGTQYYHSVPA